ncbi:P-type ATPase [Roseicyclus elongatus]|uniref:P-type ATPase n=1 Tax=Roseicyclus elongatus TaxID=159346 RepID=UPI0004B3BA79
MTAHDAKLSRPAAVTAPQGEPTTTQFHDHSVEDVFRALDADSSGLTAAGAAARLGRVGPNRLPEPPRAGPLARFLRQFKNLLIYVLIGAAMVTAALGHLVDTGVILAVVLVNAIIGFIQEGKAEQALSAIKDMLAPDARVLRDNRRTLVPAEALVPGDVVLLEPGDRVPADLRVIVAHGLRIQEAVLTGESVPGKRRPPLQRPTRRWAIAARWRSAGRWWPPAPAAVSSWRPARTRRSAASAGCWRRSRRRQRRC